MKTEAFFLGILICGAIFKTAVLTAAPTAEGFDMDSRAIWDDIGSEASYFILSQSLGETGRKVFGGAHDAWGAETNGFQTAVRLRRLEFLPDEPVQIGVVLRNVTTNELNYSVAPSAGNFGISLVLQKGTNPPVEVPTSDFIPNGPDGPHGPIAVQFKWAAKSQKMLIKDLSKLADLKEPGAYRLSARFLGSPGNNRAITNIIFSGTAEFRIVKQLSPEAAREKEEWRNARLKVQERFNQLRPVQQK